MIMLSITFRVFMIIFINNFYGNEILHVNYKVIDRVWCSHFQLNILVLCESDDLIDGFIFI